MHALEKAPQTLTPLYSFVCSSRFVYIAITIASATFQRRYIFFSSHVALARDVTCRAEETG